MATSLKRAVPWAHYSVGGLIVIMWAVIAFAWTAPADAYTTHNCKYSGTSPAIGYQYHSMESDNQTAVTNAQGNWDATATPGYFWYDSGGDPELDIYDANYSTSWWAWVDYGEHDCSTSPGTWDYNETDLQIDNGDTSGLSAAELEIVMIHELGHTYGLNHSQINCANGPAVMRQGTDKFSCSGTAPWPNDVLGVNTIY